jgi:putative DNA primase/helicase
MENSETQKKYGISDKMPNNYMVEAALNYAGLGWSVIPIKPDQKVPYVVWKDFQTQRASREQILKWWDEYPQARIGVVTGKISNLLVVDFDNPDAKPLFEKEAGKLPSTITQKTGRGSHALFKYPVGKNGFKTGANYNGIKGVDLKSDGGYIIAAPSPYDSEKSYQWENLNPKDFGLENISGMPEKMIDFFSNLNGKRKILKPVSDHIPVGERNSRLFRFALDWQFKGYDDEKIKSKTIKLAEKCKPQLSDGEIEGIIKSALSYSKGPFFKRTDTGNGERLVYHYGKNIRYSHEWDKWLVWSGSRWEMDKIGSIKQFAKETARKIYEEAARENDSAKRKKISKWAISSESEAKKKAMISSAQSEAEIPILLEDLDKDPWLFNVRNGTIDLRDGKLLPHSRKDLITKMAPIDYDPDAQAPQWIAFIDRISGGNPNIADYLQKTVGYSLTGDISEQILFFLYGTGSNGKSTFLEIIQFMMGDYAQQSDFSTFTVKQNDTVRNDLARMKGSRFVSAVEVEAGKKLAEVLVKQMTGGDKILTRFLFKEHFEYKPTYKIWLAANHQPVVRGTDEAIWRRIKLVPFNIVIPESERDKKLPQKLHAELQGIFNWSIEGSRKWQKDGLQTPPEIKRATEDYRNEMDMLGSFISENCILNPLAKVKVSKLYDEYSNWAAKREDFVLEKRYFNRLLKERGIKQKRSTGGQFHWYGIGLKENRH